MKFLLWLVCGLFCAHSPVPKRLAFLSVLNFVDIVVCCGKYIQRNINMN